MVASVYLTLVKELNHQYLFNDGDNDIRISKNLVIDIEHIVDETYLVHMPEWFAYEKELI